MPRRVEQVLQTFASGGTTRFAVQTHYQIGLEFRRVLRRKVRVVSNHSLEVVESAFHSPLKPTRFGLTVIIVQARKNIIFHDLWIGCQDVFLSFPNREQIKNDVNRNTGSFDARLTVTHIGLTLILSNIVVPPLEF
jgi:hypothetical protein